MRLDLLYKQKLFYFDYLWSKWGWLWRDVLCLNGQPQPILVSYRVLVLFIVFEQNIFSPLWKLEPIILHFLSVINGSHPLDLAPLKTKTAFSWSPGWLDITSKALSPQHCRLLRNFPENVHLPVSTPDNDRDYDNSTTILTQDALSPTPKNLLNRLPSGLKSWVYSLLQPLIFDFSPFAEFLPYNL